jgi:putative endonuclease
LTNSTQEQGLLCEQQAREYLEQHGLILIETRYHSRFGEIDLIMRDPALDQIVFVEVRSSSSSKWVNPVETIGPVKAKKIVKTAMLYLQSRYRSEPDYRFDIVTIVTPAEQIPENKGSTEWFRGALDENILTLYELNE